MNPTGEPRGASAVAQPRPAAPAVARFPTCALAVLGAAAVWALSAPVPAGRGAATALGAPVLLGLFDTVWLLCLLPGAGLLWRLVLLAVGLPFHAAVAAAAGAGGGHAVCVALLLGGFAVAGAVPRRGDGDGRPRALVPLLAVTFGLPIVAYAAAEFLGVRDSLLLRASPLTAPALLARTAAGAAPAAVAPALGAAALLLAFDVAHDALRARRGGAQAEGDR